MKYFRSTGNDTGRMDNKRGWRRLSRWTAGLLLGAATAALPLAAHADLVNGSFEDGYIANPSWPYWELFAVSTDLPGWQVVAGNIDWINAGHYWQASAGVHSLDMNGVSPGAVAQAFATVAGQSYIITFDLLNNWYCGPQAKTLRVSAAGASQEYTATEASWVTRTFQFVATSSSTTLELRSLASTGDTRCGPVVDNVRISPVNQPPVANAGPDQTVEATSPTTTLVTLNGAGSSDPDGNPLTFTWTGSFGTASGATPTVALPLGTHEITLTVADGKGRTDTDVVAITVQDKTAPAISLAVSPASLWPPNHKMVKLATSISAVDACDPNPSVSIAVTSNEPVDGLGDGDTAPDWEVVNNEVAVRAERSGKGTGRIYTITVTAKDASGNTATSIQTVAVAPNKGKNSKLAAVPGSFGLEPNSPNPFNPSTTLRYSLDNLQEVHLAIYNAMGQQVRVLVDQTQGPGSYEVEWNGQDEAGQAVAGGIYFYQLQAGAQQATGRMLFLK
ncbi:MAG: choice-of-anchor C family protein [Candidatus Latescibacteria bacterium]|nr:choice-of-anchor C family protein [Candidatus Latescibacterota bacterium]